ncbi:MAG: hypothetical protein DRQ61_05345 [Gammaproteobacteria bacterium]|nr:MAG: hypothetical protein DRQ56_05350 [Gammaproteobacteria bacterium]RLA22856.1 MAG: hypothetical protein DRQ61_05345 [Gammaproteobacteria bacterium]
MKIIDYKNMILAGLVAGAMGCTTVNPYTNEQETSNTAIGAGVGALGGALIGAMAGDRKTALLGAGIGALAGGGAGYYMDAQETKLRQRLQGTGVSVTRVGNDLILNMPGNVTFASDSANISSGFYQVLESVLLIFQEYESTVIDVTGHTDSTGAAEYNQTLSERRANSVAEYFRSRGVNGQRFLVRGAGETQPIASNSTTNGRMQNRRVEIRLSPLTR